MRANESGAAGDHDPKLHLVFLEAACHLLAFLPFKLPVAVGVFEPTAVEFSGTFQSHMFDSDRDLARTASPAD